MEYEGLGIRADRVKAHSGWKRKVPFNVSDVVGTEP